jgi:hypothetical protein
MYKYLLILFTFIVFLEDIFAQTYSFDDEELETIMESVATRSNKSNIIDRIENLIHNPINLADSPVETILQIPSFTFTMAKNIKRLVNKGLSKKEIINSLNLDKEKAYLLQYCTYIDRSRPVKKSYAKLKLLSRTRIIEQLNTLKGYENGKFQGNIVDLYQRVLSVYKNYSFGILFSKDLGEKFSNSFVSGYASAVYGDFRIDIGDFYVQTGLGNILWTQNTMGKSADVIYAAFQFDNSIYNYRSASEFGFFRGLSLTQRFNFTTNTSMKISTWASYTPQNARIGDNDSIISLDRTGLFRTESEIKKQNSIYEKSAGANMLFVNNSLNIGIAALYLDYDKPVNTKSSFAINGRNALLSTVYAIIPFGPFSFSTEISSDGKHNMAYKAIAEFKGNDFSLLLHSRSFASGFRSPYGYMFGEQSNPSNEYGLYCGFIYKGWKNIHTVAYLDYYSSYIATYYLPIPLKGVEFFTQTVAKINDNELRFRLQFENKTNAKNIDNEKRVFQRSKYYIRTDYIRCISNNCRIRARVDFNIINFESVLPDETGFAAYIESQYQIHKILKLSGRFSYFSTDSYQSAIWQYQYTLPGYLYMPPLYGNGFRADLTFILKPMKQIAFRTRFALMKKHNVSTIGSSYNEILTNTDKRLYLQLDVKL